LVGAGLAFAKVKMEFKEEDMKKIQLLGIVALAAGLAAGGCGKKPEAAAFDIAKYGIGKDAKLCPVTDEKIGGHGKPAELTLSNGKKIMVCCASCKKPIEKDLAKYASLMY
jgi:hypothetical protein